MQQSTLIQNITKKKIGRKMIPTEPPTTDEVLDTTSFILLGLPYWAWVVIGGAIIIFIAISIINSLPFKKLFFALLFIVAIVLMFGK